MNECSACGGQVALLGVLGQRIQGRCIDCGLDQSQEATKEEAQEAQEALDGD